MLNVEALEERRLMSAAGWPGSQSSADKENPNIGLLALGKHHAESGRVGGLDHSDSFNFSLSQPTKVTLALGDFTNSVGLTLVRTGRNRKVISATTATLASNTLIRSLDAGSYSVSVSAVKKQETSYTLGVATDSVGAPSRLEAEAWGGNSVHLNWNDNTVGESGYLIQRYTHKGWKNVKTVPAGSTAALVDNLVPNATTTYRVLATGIKKPVAAGHRSLQDTGGSSSSSTNNASATTQPTDTSGWYQVKLTGGMTKAYAAWNEHNDGLAILAQAQNTWFYAGSWQAAVWTAVSGQAQVDVTSDSGGRHTGDVVTHNFPNGGDFKVGTGAEIAASGGVSDFKLPHTSQDGGADTKYITLEDSYGAIDRDYDDFYWKVSTIGIKQPQITIQGTTFIKQNYLESPLNSDTILEGDDRQASNGSAVFGASINHFRTRQTVKVNPMDVWFNDNGTQAAASATQANAIGTSASYDKASSLAGGVISAAAKADTVLNDGFMKTATGTATTGGMQVYFQEAEKHKLAVSFDTHASNPLYPGAPSIDYKFLLILDYTDPIHPFYELSGTHDGFPCYEIAINGTTIYEGDSGDHGLSWLTGFPGDIGISPTTGNLPQPTYLP